MPARKTKKDDGPKPLFAYIDGEVFQLMEVNDIELGGEMVPYPQPTRVWVEELAFNEVFELERLVKQFSGNSEADLSDVSTAHLVCALNIVVRRRKNPDFSIEDGLQESVKSLTTRPPKAAAQ